MRDRRGEGKSFPLSPSAPRMGKSFRGILSAKKDGGEKGEKSRADNHKIVSHKKFAAPGARKEH